MWLPDRQTDDGQSDPYVPLCFACDTKMWALITSIKEKAVKWRFRSQDMNFGYIIWHLIYLYLLLSIGRDGQPRTSLYDKRDNFNFHITNFPFLSSNIPSSPTYGIFISQLIRYTRNCSSYECFILRRLSDKLLGQGYFKELGKCYGRYEDLIKQYEVPLSRMLHDILEDSKTLHWSDFTQFFLPCYWNRLYYII